MRKCVYCDFCSIGLSEGRNQNSGLENKVPLALVKELDAGVKKHLRKEDSITSVFIGGGTPSVVPVEDMEPLLRAIHSYVASNNAIEWTIECNPGTVDREKLELYRRYGVNRLSIGCQSIHDEELRALGRIHTSEDFFRTYELARECGFDNINVDLMNAIPGQTLYSYEKTLKRMIELEPEHISAYSLIIEPGTLFYEKYMFHPPVDEETDRRMYEMTCEMLETAGYIHYEVSNFARTKSSHLRADKKDSFIGHKSSIKKSYHGIDLEESTYACRHNLNYWRRGSYIGIGPSAASFYGNRGSYGTRTRRVDDVHSWLEYAETGSDTEIDVEELTHENALTETTFLGLRMREGVDLKILQEQFGFDAKSVWGDEINQLTANGLMENDRDHIRLTDQGLFVSDSIIDRLIRFL
ncbi:MAG: radical SAM family heme chaperone HemW [Eubacterium sp.]|nr:radical SAM family heme chaperone HemW [Eubacterium sp.]